MVGAARVKAMRVALIAGTLALAAGAILYRVCGPRVPPPGAPVQEAAFAGDPCLGGRGSCPAGCYAGPSSCSGELCTQDIACRPAGYDPRIREKGLLWLDGRAVADRPNDCLVSNPPCPEGCYEGPSRCAGPDCAQDRVCRPHGFDPRAGRLYP